jgi:hypothetical protein
VAVSLVIVAGTADLGPAVVRLGILLEPITAPPLGICGFFG